MFRSPNRRVHLHNPSIDYCHIDSVPTREPIMPETHIHSHPKLHFVSYQGYEDFSSRADDFLQLELKKMHDASEEVREHWRPEHKKKIGDGKAEKFAHLEGTKEYIDEEPEDFIQLEHKRFQYPKHQQSIIPI